MSNEMTTETVQAEAQADACVNVLKMSEVIAAIHEERPERDVPGMLIEEEFEEEFEEEAEMKGDEA